MSRTRKDSRKSTNRVLEVVRRDDGTFDLFMNGELDRGRIHEDGLNEQLCVRFGYCGKEYDSILLELVEKRQKEALLLTRSERNGLLTTVTKGRSVSNRMVIRRLTIAVAFAVLIACGSLYLWSRLLNQRARTIVDTAFELTEQHQPPTIADIEKRFGSTLRLDECRASECGYRVVVSNRILAAFQIVPRTEMESYFWAKDGVVFRNMVDYTTTVNRRYRVVSHVQIDFCKGCQAVDIHPWDAASPLDTNGLVGIGSEATAQNRRTILSINTGCLTRLGGCQTVADLLPAAWKRTADGKIACVIQNDRGFVEKPANWP